jgi:phospholipid-binding lipoprotein MlaA
MKRGFLIVAGIVTVAGCSGQVQNPSALTLQDPSIQSPTASPAHVEDPQKDEFDEFEAEFSQKPVMVPDPLEGWNRVMFRINDRLYFWVLKPVAQAYQHVAPPPVRTGVRNFFHNLTTPVRFVSCFLQGKVDDAGMEFGRFMVNSTWGILGVADPAKDRLGLELADDEDMGQALGVHGAGHGFYIVWPIWGPSSLRDSVGLVGDQFLNPLGYVRPWGAYVGLYVFKVTNDTSLHIGDYETLKSAAIEPYTALRDAYIQYRAKQARE